MSHSSADYTAALQSLLPSGLAWSRDPEAVLTALLAAKADGLAQVDAAADALLLEADPRTTVELLATWERNYGVPLPGVPLAADTASRQQAVVNQMTFQPGKSRAWWLSTAANLGFDDAVIVEHRPFRAGMSCAGDPVSTDPWRYRWEFIVYSADSASVAALTLQALVARYASAETLAALSFVDPDAALFEYDFLAGP